MGTDRLAAYQAARARIAALIVDLDDETLARPVPACPDWTVHDLVAHNVGIPAAIADGDLPGADQQGWLDGLVRARRSRTVDQLLDEWATLDDAISGVLSATPVLLLDLATHEHDLRGAVGRPDHDALAAGIVVPAALGALVPASIERGLGAIVVDTPTGWWRSHDDDPGWTLRTTAWEAFRAIGSRRTAAEVGAVAGDGDATSYLDVIDEHLPLPRTSLAEP